MSYSEMLNEFMENELPTNREETLFHALARDEDLRFEMKYLLSLRNVVKEDDEAGVVPLATTRSLFSRLGYAAAIPASESVIGAAGAAGAASAGAGSGFGLILRGWGSHLLAGLVGMLLAGTFFMIDQSTDGSSDTSIATNESKVDQTKATAIEAENIGESIADNGRGEDLRDDTPAAETSVASTRVTAPMVRSGSDAEERGAPVMLPQNDGQGAADDDLISSNRGEIHGNGLNETTSEASVDATATPDTDFARDIDRSIELTQSTAVASNPTEPDVFLNEGLSERMAESPVQLPEQEYETYGHFNLTARGSMVPVNIAASKLGLDMDRNQGLNRNFAIGIEYGLLPDLTFSVEGGLESYLMYFREERASGVTNEYEAITTPLLVNGTLRWTPIDIGPVPLYVQGGIGFSWSGPIARLMVGGEFNLEESVTLIGGAEISSLGYQYQNELLFSPRFGLTGGIRLNNLFQIK